MLVPHELAIPVLVESQTFFDLGAKIGYNFYIKNRTVSRDMPNVKTRPTVVLQLNAGVMNVFNSYQKDLDVGLHRDSGYIYGPLMPRSYFVGVRLNL
jgi:outer membrane receptor for ferrienterochelin and colicins